MKLPLLRCLSILGNKTKLYISSTCPNDAEYNQSILNNWLQTRINKEFNITLKRCLKKFDMPAPALKIRKLSRRWGSHIKPNTVILNSALISVRRKCIEYVIMHELCHYFHKNHSQAFFSLLGAKMPDWGKLKDELEKSYLQLQCYSNLFSLI